MYPPPTRRTLLTPIHKLAGPRAKSKGGTHRLGRTTPSACSNKRRDLLRTGRCLSTSTGHQNMQHAEQKPTQAHNRPEQPPIRKLHRERSTTLQLHIETKT